MTHDALAILAASIAVVALAAYAVLGGADFGGGVWDLLAAGPRKQDQRQAVAHAMGPVWEANHVWLIFLVVLLYTCFPRGFFVLVIALFLPLHLALLGIMLRGAAFVFRKYGDEGHGDAAYPKVEPHPSASPRVWGAIFGVASLISPVLLGMAFGAVTAGGVRADDAGRVWTDPSHPIPWLTPYSVGCGLLALSACAYLAAVYLVAETDGELRRDFHRRAILAGTTTAVLAGVVLVLARREAPWFFRRLTSTASMPVLVVGLLLFAASAAAVFGHRYRLSRIFAAGEVVILLAGWGLAHGRYLIYPDVPLLSAAAPAPTLKFVLGTLPVGFALLAPSLWLLFKVFKSTPVGNAEG